MTVAEVLELYAYNRWAHESVLRATAALSVEQYTRQIGGSFPSLRATMEHLLRAEIAWLARWNGQRSGPSPELDCPDVGALAGRWVPHWAEQRRFLLSLVEEDFARPVDIRLWSGIETVQPLAETLRHVVNHATYHRGQVTTLTRQLGGAPASTDYFTYLLLRDAGQLPTPAPS